MYQHLLDQELKYKNKIVVGNASNKHQWRDVVVFGFKIP
jgi:hypothetical protein